MTNLINIPSGLSTSDLEEWLEDHLEQLDETLEKDHAHYTRWKDPEGHTSN